MRLRGPGFRAVLVLCALAPRAARCQEDVSCCEAGVNVGFSEEAVRDGALFEGIVGVGDLCTADQGEIVTEATVGTRPKKKIHVAIVSNLSAARVEGWSYGVLLEGAARVLSVTTAGTAVDTVARGGYLDQDEGYFNKTQIIDPAKNGGQRGFVSAIAHTTQNLVDPILPLGTHSVAVAELEPEASQGYQDQVTTLRFQRGLIGCCQPVDLVVTVQGNSASVCNFNLSRVNVVFRADLPHFYRGDANGDARVDISDAIWILSELFLGGPASPCADAADANDDGLENATDAILLIDYIFLGSRPPPPAPGPEACGPDPAEDLLDCGGLTGCS